MLYYLLTISCLVSFHVNSQYLELDEGSVCHSDGYPGRCVNIYRCLGTTLARKEKWKVPICAFQGKVPIVCCTDCELVNDTSKIVINPGLGFLYKTGRKAEDACTNFKHIVKFGCKGSDSHSWRYFLTSYYVKEYMCWNVTLLRQDGYGFSLGEDAERNQYPHMALLGYGEDISSAQWLCGGTVISERFILTAGHCLSHPKVGNVKYIALGILRRSDPIERWQIYNVKRMVRHPEYAPPSKYHDIALLETDAEIKFSDDVHPACLHTKGEADEVLTGTGWGALGHRQQLADTLQTLDISRFNEEECKQHYPPHRHLLQGYNHATQMCYGDRVTVADSCEGDSGGPLQSATLDENRCVTTVVGVTSSGKQCGITSGSGLYTRVIHYVPWIESVVWP